MSELTFVVYGAASDIVAPIFSHYENAEFICLVNQSKPSHLKGQLIDANAKGRDEDLSVALKAVPSKNTIVFLNAAVYQNDELFISQSVKEINKMVSVGVTQALLISQVVLTEMVRRRKGRLINLSSFRAKAPAAGAAVYAAIKSFGDAFYSAIGIEYGRLDITSNSVAIGFAQSKLLNEIDNAKLMAFKKSISKNKFLPKEEFLRTLDYLIASDYVNASVVDLDGGIGYLS